MDINMPRMDGLTATEIITSRYVDTKVLILSIDDNVEYIEPNYIISLEQTPNDPEFSQLWGLHNEGQTGGTVDADSDTDAVTEDETEEPENIDEDIEDTGDIV